MSVQLSSWPESLSGYSIEIAIENHNVEAIAAVVNAAYKKVAYLREDVDRITPQEITAEVANPCNRLYLCLSPTKTLCGTLLVGSLAENQAKLNLFAIHPDYQGSGLGSEFLKFVEQETFKTADTIILKVIPLFQEKLVKYYEQQKYKAVGDPGPFPQELLSKYIRPDCWERISLITMQKERQDSD